MIDRRRFLLSSLAGALAAPLAVEAQQSPRSVHRVGWLDPGSSTGEETPELAAFRESMRELGWVEGTNVVYESAFAEGNAERLPALAVELITRKVDVIVTGWHDCDSRGEERHRSGADRDDRRWGPGPHRPRALAILSRLPLMTSDRSYAEAGFLLTHGFQYIERVRAAAPYVDKISRGANPGELPIEQPRRTELVINLKTAKALGLTIPPSLLLRADQVIE